MGVQVNTSIMDVSLGVPPKLESRAPILHNLPCDLLGPRSQASVLCHGDVVASLTVAKDWNQPSLSPDEQVVKIWYQYRLEFYQL